MVGAKEIVAAEKCQVEFICFRGRRTHNISQFFPLNQGIGSLHGVRILLLFFGEFLQCMAYGVQRMGDGMCWFNNHGVGKKIPNGMIDTVSKDQCQDQNNTHTAKKRNKACCMEALYLGKARCSVLQNKHLKIHGSKHFRGRIIRLPFYAENGCPIYNRRRCEI